MRRTLILLCALLLAPALALAQFTIPNYATATYKTQAAPDSFDFTIMTRASAGTGVVSGCGVTSNGNMTVAVAGGVVSYLGVLATLAGGDVTIASVGVGGAPRFDLVTSTSAGVKAVVQGTAGASPELPTTANVVLAAVYVPVGTTVIATENIIDKRVIVPGGVTGGAVLVPDGGPSTPSVASAANPTWGIYWNVGASRISVTLAGNPYFAFYSTPSFLIMSNSGTLSLGASSDTTLGRASANVWTIGSVLFSALGTPANGAIGFCSDCNEADPCAGGGSGALAVRHNGRWDCR